MNQNKRNNNVRKRRAKRGRQKRGGFKTSTQSGNLIVRDNPRFPNDVKQFPICNRVIRYITTAAVTSYSWTAKNLLFSQLWATNLSAQVFSILGSVRLKRVSMYYVSSTGDFGASTSVISFSWVGTTNAPDNLIVDRGTATMPACIKVRPIANSQSGFWYDANSAGILNALFIISCPASTVIDVEYEFIIDTIAKAGTLTLSANSSYTGVMLLGYDGAVIVPDGGVGTGHV